MSILNREFPPPIDWQAFERLCCDLYRGRWGDPETQLHGRAGQEQHGVDVFGREAGIGWVGVQCKGKNAGYGAKPTIAELRREMGKAKKFRPPLRKFLFATTAPNDAALQQEARLLTEDHREAGLFEVHALGWDTLKQYVAADIAVVRTQYPDLAPVDMAVDVAAAVRSELGPDLSAITEALQFVKPQIGTAAAAVQPVPVSPPPGSLLARLKDVAELCNEGEPNAAMLTIQRFRREEWDTAGPEDRSRIPGGPGILSPCRLQRTACPR